MSNRIFTTDDPDVIWMAVFSACQSNPHLNYGNACDRADEALKSYRDRFGTTGYYVLDASGRPVACNSQGTPVTHA